MLVRGGQCPWVAAEFADEWRTKILRPVSCGENRPLTCIFVSGWRDLNPRPLRPERSALPSCATPRWWLPGSRTFSRRLVHLSGCQGVLRPYLRAVKPVTAPEWVSSSEVRPAVVSQVRRSVTVPGLPKVPWRRRRLIRGRGLRLERWLCRGAFRLGVGRGPARVGRRLGLGGSGGRCR